MVEHLSISAMRSFQECPRCFWLKYIAKNYDERGPALKLGSEVHEALAEYHGGTPAEELSETAQKLVDVYKAEVPKDIISKTELKFKIPLVHIGSGEELPVKFKGYIDGVDEKTGWMFEHKTSSRYWKPEDVATDVQATGYAYAYYHLYGEVPKGIRFNIIKKNKVTPKMQFIETFRTEEDIINFWYWAKYVYDEILKSEFEPRHTRFEYHHTLCPYYVIRSK